MFDFRPALSASLREALNRYDTTVQEVVCDESCLRGFNSNDPALVSFLTDRVSDVLDMALFSDNPKYSAKALALFTKENDALIRAAIEENLLAATSASVFTAKPEYPIVSRFAYITQLVCLQEPTNCINNCSYLYDFLPFCGYRLVLGMFEELFQDQEKTETIQMQLHELVDKLKVNIMDKNLTFTDDINDENAVKMAGYYQLISVIKDAELFKDSLRNADTLLILARQFDVLNITVLDSQWKTLSELVTPENANALQSIVQSTLIPLLSRVDNPTFLHQYQVSLLYVILAVAQANEQIRKYLIDLNFHVELREIVAQFPHHTLAHMAVSNFILQSAKMVEFECLILSVMLPFCENILSQETPIIELRAFVWDLLVKIKKAIENNEVSDKFKETFAAFDEECNKKLDELTQISESEYGGKLPETNDTIGEEDGLNNLSPEQIMQLLKFLTSSSGMRR